MVENMQSDKGLKHMQNDRNFFYVARQQLNTSRYDDSGAVPSQPEFDSVDFTDEDNPVVSSARICLLFSYSYSSLKACNIHCSGDDKEPSTTVPAQDPTGGNVSGTVRQRLVLFCLLTMNEA